MKQITLKGIEDFSRDILPEDHGDPYYFRNQLTDPQRFRPLKKEEIEIYEGQKVEYFSIDEIKKMKNLAPGALSSIQKYEKLLK